MEDEDNFECALSATSLVLIPRDPEKPCMGPFRCRGQSDVEDLKNYAHSDLGLEPDEYDLRVTIEVDPMIWKGDFYVH